MSAMSCQVISWVVKGHITTMSHEFCKSNVMKSGIPIDTHEYEESCQLKSHRKLNNHEGRWRVTRVKHHSWLYIPPHCTSKQIFTLAPPTKHREFSVSSLRSKEWLQCPITGTSDVWCTNVSWESCLIQKPVKANTFSCMFCRCL